MSNVIKAYSVRYEVEEKKTIDTHLRIDRELEERRKKVLQETFVQGEGEFSLGLRAVVIDPPPQEQEAGERALEVLEEANKEAKSILENARNEAEKIKNEAYANAQKKGYGDGMLQSQMEVNKIKAEYEEKARDLQKRYEEMTAACEPQMAEIIAALVEKITGIVVEDREEVILYLIDRALNHMDKSDEYTIRISKEDYEAVSLRKNMLLDAIGREVSLYITADAALKKNQCLIETEFKVINCSLDIQMNNLIADLRLLAGI